MKILASGDHHFDRRSRFDECVKVHQWMVDLAREEKVDAFLSGGDVYERASTPDEREAVAEWLTRTAEVCPALLVKGNHEAHVDLMILRRLRSRFPVLVEERAGVYHIGPAAIAAVAWPEKKYLLAQSGDSQQADADVRLALQSVIRGLGAQLSEHDGPRIALGHFMVDGSVVSTGQPLLGMPLNIGLTELALFNAHAGFMSHIHKHQTWDVAGAPFSYAGSPIRTDFGQLEKKVVLLAEFDGPRLLGVREIETPARRMVHVEAHWDESTELPGLACSEWLDADVCGAEIRLRYRAPLDRREPARAHATELAAAMKEAGAYSIKVEEQLVSETRARIPEVAGAPTLSGKVQAFWKAKGFEPGKRREPLLSKLGELEKESAA